LLGGGQFAKRFAAGSKKFGNPRAASKMNALFSAAAAVHTSQQWPPVQTKR
jgi:hypothetical protein